MTLRVPPWAGWACRSPVGLVLAVLALVSQMALGAMVLPDAAQARQASALDALSVMCGGAPQGHVDHAPGAPRRHHAAEVALCPLSGALAGQAVVMAPAPVLPALGLVARPVWRMVDGARGPPLRVARPGFARGPPILV